MKSISYIIGHRSADEFRTRNLFITVEWLYHIKQLLVDDNINLSIVIVEQDKASTLQATIPPYVEYYFVKNDGFYNRGWAFNVGFRIKYTDDYFYFADNDIIINIKNMIYVLKTCFNYEAVNPYKDVYDTESTIKDIDVKSFYMREHKLKHLIAKDLIKGKRTGICFSGGIVGISRTAMVIIAGWDERFRGRGWEDYAMTAKINLFLKNTATYSCKSLHIYHPWEQNSTRQNNFELDNQYINYTVDNYVAAINDQRQFIGIGTKYSVDSPMINDNIKVTDISFEKRIAYALKYYNKLKGKCCCKKNMYHILSGQMVEESPHDKHCCQYAELLSTGSFHSTDFKH